MAPEFDKMDPRSFDSTVSWRGFRPRVLFVRAGLALLLWEGPEKPVQIKTIYQNARKVFLEHIWDGLGKQILSVFVVDPLSGACLDLPLKCFDMQILLLFSLDPLSGASWECLCELFLTPFAVYPLSGASLNLSWVCFDKSDLSALAIDLISGASLD